MILAAHPWDGVPYGFHHIARALARLGWMVLYIEPYFSPLHLVSGRRRGRILGGTPRAADEPGLYVLSPFTLVPHANLPLLRSRGSLNLARSLSWPRLRASHFAGTPFSNPELVLCGSPVAVDAALSLNAKTSVYRLADDSSLFDVLTPAIRQAEIDAIPGFDVVIATSDALRMRARQLNAKRTLLVSNGVDRAFFERPAPVPGLMANLPEPRILYAGAVENWFDWPLVAQAAQERPGYSFAIVGRVGSPSPVELPPNVHLMGRRPFSEMPAFMQAASVGVIPFASSQRKAAIQAINPLKLYEYLAAGRPVVSSVRPPSLSCEGLFVYSHPGEFMQQLDEAVDLAGSGTRIRAPEHVDWIVIVSEMLNDLGKDTPSTSRSLRS